MSKQKELVVGTIIGGVIGATTAILTTPKSGPEARQDISDQFEEGKAKTEDVAKQLKGKVDGFTEMLDERSSNISKAVVEEGEHVIAEAKKAIDELRKEDDINSEKMKKVVKSIMKEELKSGKDVSRVVKEEMKNVQKKLNEDVEELVKKAVGS